MQSTTPTPFEQPLTRYEAAEALDCSTVMLDRMIRAGKLKVFRIGRRVKINPSEIRRIRGLAET